MRNLVKKAVAAACVLSTAAMCTMTSALAVNENYYADGKVTIPVEATADIFTQDRKDNKTQMTTMVVTKAKWDSITTTALTADDIYYINQDEAAALQKLLAGDGTTAGVKGGSLADGTYVALIGGEDVEASDIKVIEFSVSSTPVEVPITSITVEDITLAPNDKKKLVVVPNAEATEVGEYTFDFKAGSEGTGDVIENASIKLNKKTGEVEAISPGDTQVVVMLNSNPDVKAEATVSVVDDGEQIAVTVNPTTKTLAVDEKVQLEATVTPNTAAQGVTWSVTSGEGVVTVSETGEVTAVKEGTATVTATSVEDATKSASCVITVTNGGGDDYDPANYGKTWAYLGDVDMEDGINAADALAIQLYKLNRYSLNDLQKVLADVDKEDGINAADALAIQLYKLGRYPLAEEKIKLD